MKKIFIAGHAGMVGSALYRCLLRRGVSRSSILTATRRELDLTSQSQVTKFLSHKKPDTVILAAAKVGGIEANRSFPYEFLNNNLSIQSNILNSCLINRISNICFLGSSCMYPNEAKQPFSEDDILSGPFEPTNEAYALAKVVGLKTCQYLRQQHGLNAFTVIPNNSYGINDHYSASSSHVIPSIISKIHQAVSNNEKSITCWGSGKPSREFIYVDDLADAIITLLATQSINSKHDIYNIASNCEITIYELVHLIARKLNYGGKIRWDTSKPDGMLRKSLETTRISDFNLKFPTELSDGLDLAITDFKSRY